MRKCIPNAITSMNLLCGILGVVFAFKGRVDLAFPLMLGGALFDFCDGLAARALGAYSDMGKELDSLADLVTFGVLPSVMLYKTATACTFSDNWYCWTPLAMALFSGLRLAKFNVDERQHSCFLGLPTPACAMICGSLCYYVSFTPWSTLAQWCAIPAFLPVCSAVLCFLLVCELPMFSFKFSKEDTSSLKWKRIAFALFGALVIACVAVLKLNWSLAVLMIFIIYILNNAVLALFKL